MFEFGKHKSLAKTSIRKLGLFHFNNFHLDGKCNNYETHWRSSTRKLRWRQIEKWEKSQYLSRVIWSLRGYRCCIFYNFILFFIKLNCAINFCLKLPTFRSGHLICQRMRVCVDGDNPSFCCFLWACWKFNCLQAAVKGVKQRERLAAVAH